MRKRSSVRVKDVAALAGVSAATVSNVLNKPHRVSPDTCRRVMEAIDKLGWVRDESARQLRTGRSASVGVVLRDIANPFFSDMARGIEEVAVAAGFSVLLSDSAHSQDRERVAVELYQQLRVRGIILAPVSGSPDLQLTRRLHMPVVLANRSTAFGDACIVSVDNFVGGQLAVAHLLEGGHQRLGAVGGTANIPQVRDRRDGARRALLLGNSDATMLTISTERFDIATGRSAAADIANMPEDERPTGIFALNDLLAIGLLQGFVAQGLAVPEDICIVGYDDIEFAAAAAVPLSSISQPRAELGSRAAELLLNEMAAEEGSAPHKHSQLLLTPSLVVRSSSVNK